MKKVYLIISALYLVNVIAYSQLNKVNEQKIKKHIEYLASDELTGRHPGTEGEEKAASYIWKELKSAGCESFYKNGVQHFTKEIKSRSESGSSILLKGQNVVGYIKGHKNPDTYIVVGAHYDHLGMGGVGSGSRKPDTLAVHNGADDNASGVSAVLECARILSKQKPDCSIIFVAFSAEEKGLVGSKYFIDNPPVKKEQIKAMVNFDMVGRLDSVLTVQGIGTASEIDSLITVSDKNLPFQIKRVVGGFGPSDQTSFYAEKIPVVYFHTSIHDQYHTPFDDIELINMKGVSQITAFASDIIQNLAKDSQQITYQAVGDQSEMSRRGMKATLGIMPEHTSADGLIVNAVRPGQAGEKGGILKGDKIIFIQGEKVNDIESYMSEMNKHAKGDTIQVEIIRDGEKQTLTINL